MVVPRTRSKLFAANLVVCTSTPAGGRCQERSGGYDELVAVVG